MAKEYDIERKQINGFKSFLLQHSRILQTPTNPHTLQAPLGNLRTGLLLLGEIDCLALEHLEQRLRGL